MLMVLTISAAAACLCSPPAAEPAHNPKLSAEWWHAAWCGACRQMEPAVKALREDGWPIVARDYDGARTEARRKRVQALPTTLVIDTATGREVARTVGAVAPDALRRWLMHHGLEAGK